MSMITAEDSVERLNDPSIYLSISLSIRQSSRSSDSGHSDLVIIQQWSDEPVSTGSTASHAIDIKRETGSITGAASFARRVAVRFFDPDDETRRRAGDRGTAPGFAGYIEGKRVFKQSKRRLDFAAAVYDDFVEP